MEDPEVCFDCYHCVAACPHEAFTHKNATPAQCLPIREEWRTRMNKPLLLLLALTAVASARPPLIVTPDQVDEGVGMIRRALSD